MTGYVSSIQTLGTVDGPGVRFVIFMQGCNLRCGCCHNPETWEIGKGDQYTAQELAEKISHYKEYFGEKGGVTLSGGEPLLQAEFAAELFGLCKARGINTCLDTSGSVVNAAVRELLKLTDYILLDIKYTTDELYRKYVGCSIDKPLEFLLAANEAGVTTRLRQVIIPTLNDSEENILRLKELAGKYPTVDGIELLPFKKLCSVKYEQQCIPFSFADIPVPSKEKMALLAELL